MGSYQVISKRIRQQQVEHGRLARLREDMAAAYVAQGGLCASCGHKMLKLGDHYGMRARRPSCEHVIPRSMGGSDHLGNIVATHWICNSLKSDRKPTGCEPIFLLAVNARLGVKPDRW
jgi:5-methylcytosine-specific restriction endonuclease McrA